MTQFYIPKTMQIKMPDGMIHVVIKGIREVPDDLADSPLANRHGIKPVHEMNDAECADLGLPPVPKTVILAPKQSPAPAPPIATPPVPPAST